YYKNYFHYRPTWDFKRQVRGEEIEKYIKLTINLIISKRVRLVKILYYQLNNLGKGEIAKLSIKVINLYIALYSKRETVKRKRLWLPTNRLQLPTNIKFLLTSKYIKLKQELEPEPDLFPLLIRVTQCLNYIGDKQLME
ncbi:hypothetical protein F5883DRAFT_433278, partial [Diaporthe sp. PMI_573]